MIIHVIYYVIIRIEKNKNTKLYNENEIFLLLETENDSKCSTKSKWQLDLQNLFE